MERIVIPPGKTEFGSPVWYKLFHGLANRHNLYYGIANPVVSEVPQGQMILYKNTALNEIRWWVNDNGTMKKSAAFT